MTSLLSPRPIAGAAELDAAELDVAEIRRYGRHLILPEVGPEGQKRLKAARVLLVGAGGLGSPLGLYLAAAGVGTLGLIDDDRVDVTNLQRQVLYGQSDLERPKTEAAVERLGEVNPHVEIEPHGERLTAQNALELVEAYDVIVDGSDNFPTRYLVNDAAFFAKKPVVWGAIQRFEGQLSVFWAERGPCYRCLFPEPPPAGLVPSCAEAGVIGVLPGVIGTLQANEVIKLLLDLGRPMIGRLLIFDALKTRFREIALAKNRSCPICGDAPRIHALEAHDPTCETAPREMAAEPEHHQGEEDLSAASPPADTMDIHSQDIHGQDVPFEIAVEELDHLRQEGRELDLVDVREPVERAICRIGDDSRLVPLRELPRRLGELDAERLTVVYCHHGGRSAQAVRFLRQQGFTRATNLAGGIDAWSQRVDPTVPRY